MDEDEESGERREEFRENLTLGVMAALDRLPGVENLTLCERSPCDQIAITSWEQRYSTVLPHEVKDFYLATDGFRLTWSFNHAGQAHPLGRMNIHRICDLRRVAGLRHRFDSEQPTLLDLEVVNNRDKSNRVAHAPAAADDAAPIALIKPQFGLRWKMFELDHCSGDGRVCLVFPPKPDPLPVDESGTIQLDVVPPTPQVWYLDRASDWHFLAPSFTQFFRMMLVHLGLPQWQALFTPFGPTPRAKYVINLLAPHLLQSRMSTEGSSPDENQDRSQQQSEEMATTTSVLFSRREEFPVATLDPAVFKAKGGRAASRKSDDTAS